MPNPFARLWAQVVDELSQQLKDRGKTSYTGVVNKIFPLSSRPKSDAKCIERFVEEIEYCRSTSSVSDFPKRLKELSDLKKWDLSEEDLELAASLVGGNVLKSADDNSDTSRISDLLQVARATIVVGVRWPDPARERDQIDRWDFKSYATLVEKLRSHYAAIEVEPFDVGANSPDFIECLLDNSLIGSDLVIFVGSARSNRLSNAALAKMFGRNMVRAWTLGSVDSHDRLPFHFCWNTPEDPGYYPSQMEIPVHELKNPKVKEAVSQKQAYAFEFQGEEEAVNHKCLSGIDYGVILAQRRRTQTWILALGASGPATQQCCEMIFDEKVLRQSVPSTGEGVLCQAISCHVKRVAFAGVPYHLADNRSPSSPTTYKP